MDTINLQYTAIQVPLPDSIWKNLRSFSAHANAYHPQPMELIEKLAQLHNLPKEMFYLTVGITEAIQMFAFAYGKHAYTFTPTFCVYADVEEFGGRLTRIPSIVNNEYKIPINKQSDATLIYLANPNNPAGFTTKENVVHLIENNKQAIVVIDEAYAEFGDFSVIHEVPKYPHAAVLRSFSKSYGMAGNRIGYIVAHPDILKKVKNKTQWANVSYLSVGAAIAVLGLEKHFEKIRDDIIAERQSFTEFLKSKGFSYIPSQINAALLHFDSEDRANSFTAFLNRHNIIVSQGNADNNIGLDNSYVRIAIGNHEQMEKVKHVIEKFK